MTNGLRSRATCATAFAAVAFPIWASMLAAAPPNPAVGSAPVAADTPPEFPRDWFWGNDQQRRAQDALLGTRAPALEVSRWVGESHKLQDLRGKVVVIDFWATWCGPCIRAMPVNKAMIEQYAEKGLVFIGIHDHRRGLDRLDAVMEQHAITYPVAVDDGGKSARAWKLAFWPTYCVIDREGLVRAVGLQPDRVRDVVAKLIAEPVPADLVPKGSPKDAPTEGQSKDHDTGESRLHSGHAASADHTIAGLSPATVVLASPLPPEWTERLPETRRDLDRLIGDPAPPLPDGTWINARPLGLADLRGKVVLLDFWATWCAPCIAAIPELNRFQERYARHGLVIVGVCHGRGAERMADVAQRHRIQYPIVSDPQLAAVKAYRVDTYPDYYLIDRMGRVRGVDLRFESLEPAIERLLSE